MSKIIGFVILPSNAIGLLGIAGVLLVFKAKRLALAALASSAIMLITFGLSPLPNVLLLVLSERFPAWQQGTERPPDGIVVLGGAIDAEASAARGLLEVDGSADRILATLDLAHRYPDARIVYSGGSGHLLRPAVAEAPMAGRLLDDLTLSRGRVVLESRSRTTDENATETRRLVTPQPGERWLLVTSAFHMPRSIAAFRANGFDVEAYPVDFRTTGWDDALTPFNRISQGLSRADAAMHEWVGLIGLRLTGRSAELFPSPRPVRPSVLPGQP